MSQLESDFYSGEPLPSVVTIANLVYGLHAFAIVVGIAGTPTVVGSFLGSVPSIAGVVLNYVKRADARGTWVASHYSWQIRTFWYAALWMALAAILLFTVIGIPLAFALFGAVTIWLVYRIARGWLRLRDHLPMYA